MRELRPGLWHWQAPHPDWRASEPWDQLVAMAVAQFPPIFNNPWIAGLYYVIAGVGWVLPAMPLVRWMLKGSVSSR